MKSRGGGVRLETKEEATQKSEEEAARLPAEQPACLAVETETKRQAEEEAAWIAAEVEEKAFRLAAEAKRLRCILYVTQASRSVQIE